jgi:hypothetical protein
MTGNALGQETAETDLWKPRFLASGEVPLPDRITQSDIVVVGKVAAVEPKDVEAVFSPQFPYTLDYRISVVKVQEVIRGPKDVKDLRLGFISPDQDRKVDKNGKAIAALPSPLYSVKVGDEGVFILQKHHQGNFYVNVLFLGGFLAASDSAEFTKIVENARRLSKVLESPLEALKSENAANRYVAAVMLISRYRVKGAKTEAINVDESKLLLKSLAEADWGNVNEALVTMKYPPHPYKVFLQLGVTKTDGYEPPAKAPDIRETLKYTQNWLRDNQETYRIQRFVGAK